MNISRETTRKICYLAILTALVVVLQTVLGQIKIGVTSFSVVLIPIVIGSILLGVWGGAFLGLVFALIVFIYGLVGADAFTLTLLTYSPVLTTAMIFAKGVLAGVVPALLYKLIAKKNSIWATVVASLSAPIVNTGIFILGSLCMAGVFDRAWSIGSNEILYYLVIVCAGINFLVEFGVTAIISPALTRVVKAVDRRI